MSILSSNGARFRVTTSYLAQNGYIYRATSIPVCLIRQDAKSKSRNQHIIYVSNPPGDYGELLYVHLGSKKGDDYIIPINDIRTLRLLEAFWNTRDENKKSHLKKKLIKTPGTDVRHYEFSL